MNSSHNVELISVPAGRLWQQMFFARKRSVSSTMFFARKRSVSSTMFFARKRSVSNRCFLRESEASAARCFFAKALSFPYSRSHLLTLIPKEPPNLHSNHLLQMTYVLTKCHPQLLVIRLFFKDITASNIFNIRNFKSKINNSCGCK